MNLTKKRYKTDYTKENSKVVSCNVNYTNYADHKLSETFYKMTKAVDNFEASYVNSLPHLGALIELWELVTQVYGVKSIGAMHSLLERNGADISFYNAFVSKYVLHKTWPLFRYYYINGEEYVAKSTL